MRALFVAVLLVCINVSAFALEPGHVAPNFSLATKLPKSAANDLRGLKSRVVIVDFWAHWCKPCRGELKVLAKLYEHYKAHGLMIVGVSVDREKADMERFLRELKTQANVELTFPVVHDVGQNIAQRYKPEAMPSSYVIDAKGRVRHIHFGFRGGYRKGDGLVLENQIRALLGLAPLQAR